MTTVASQEIVSAHSPDSDDAFMFYALATKKVRSSRVTFRHVLSDIETLNRQAMEGVDDLSAISYHAYPYVADKYVLMASGSSIGDGYGPMIIANHPMEPDELKGKRIAIPGTMTTAYLAAKLYQPDFEAVVTPFDKITDAVREHSVDAGLIIHDHRGGRGLVGLREIRTGRCGDHSHRQGVRRDRHCRSEERRVGKECRSRWS